MKVGAPAEAPAVAPGLASAIQPGTVERVGAQLIARHGEAHAAAIRRGVRQAAERWWATDGDDALFESFCIEQYTVDESERAAYFARLEEALEQVDGHLHEIRRELRRPVDLDIGPVSRVDFLLQDVDLWAHVDEDLFRSKVAFLALLHFPVHTLEERLQHGAAWSREEWARSRMMDRFAERVPPPVLQGIAKALHAADFYIAEYNIHMDRLRTRDGAGPFPRGLQLISHWGLRDELKSRYDEGAGGLLKQRMIYQVMRRIVCQEIPGAVRETAEVAWCPETNAIEPNGSGRATREPDTRYHHLLEVFRSIRAADPYAPAAPTFIRRRFELDRQIPEAEVEALIRSVLESSEVATLAERIAQRLGRPLEPFDIWYSGFMPRGARSEEELDRAVRARFPTVAAVEEALPELLTSLGFSPERAAWLAERIVVDAARGAGHAMGAVRREDKAHLRTRAHGGMSYKSFNIAMHELGHNVEQVFSLNGIDHWSLNGVPNTAFTEAFAFVFQSRDLEVLGFPAEGEDAHKNEVLQSLWATYEIGGVSLVDMKVWNWMYTHPEASPAELREAVVSIAREVWNRWYAPIFGERDVELLAIYSHLIQAALYLPDYAIGQIVAFQVAPRLRAGSFGEEVERMTRLGRLTPDAWMRAATGSPISTGPLLEAARAALHSRR
jgi:hypothetical protein